MAANGWIKLHRKIKDHCLWTERRKFSKFEAWIDILLNANHEPREIIINSKVIKIERGQQITSEIKLSDRWNWNRKTVRKFLTVLENEKMILKKATTQWTTLTVVNYDIYQGEGTTDRTTKGTAVGTTMGQRSGHKQELKNDKKERISTFIKTDLSLILANELFDLIQNNNPTVKQPDLQSWAIDIDRMIRLDKRTEWEIREVIQFSQADSFWQANILSAKKLREKYDQLYLKSKSQNKNKTQTAFDVVQEYARERGILND